MLGRRDASSSSSGLLRSQFALEGFELLSSVVIAGYEVFDGRDVFVSKVEVSRWFIVIESIIRPAVSWCLEIDGGCVGAVIVRDPKLVILARGWVMDNG